MKKDRKYLIDMYNATSTDNGKDKIETYKAWLERQLLKRINDAELVDIQELIVKAENNGWSYNNLKRRWFKDGWSDKTLNELNLIFNK